MAGSFYSPETPESSWTEVKDRLAPALLSSEFPITRESIDDIWERFESLSADPFARAGMEGACWDLLCQESRQPLWEMLGSAPRPIPSGVAVGLYDTIDELLERVARFVGQGYQRVKIKIQPGWDLEPVRAIRERFGDVPLMVDANAAYRLDQASVFEELDRFSLMMYEQPFAAAALDEMAELQRLVRTPVCADESADSLAALDKILELGSARILNIKIQRVGGLAPALAMYIRAREAGMPCWLGTMPELGIASAQGLHLATLPGFSYPTDVESSLRWYTDDIVRPLIEIDRQGNIELPHSPGSGFRPDMENLERYSIDRAEMED
jgi:O-succinylbenzoate synthase